MPVYEYVCNDCQEAFDTLVRSLAAADEVECRSCASSNVKRKVSRIGMVGGLDDPLTVSRDAVASGGGCCGGSCGCGH